MKRLWMLILIFALALLLVSCNLPGSTPPNSDQAEQTFVAMTVAAGLTQNAPANTQPGDTQAVETQPQDPTNTQVPTNTNVPTNTPQPTATATETTPCNQATFVKDVTIPDGTVFGPGDTFTKTWRLKNTGSCNWNGDYELVFDSGDKLGGGTVEDLSIGTIEPGETVDISVDLKAPNTPGDYKGNWMLRSDDNEVFALGDGDVPFYVDIEVAEKAAFEITSTNQYMCSGDKYVAMRIKNTGTDELESSAISVKNLDTNLIVGVYFGHNNSPFTEDKDNCPPMGIDNMDPGDLYYVTYNIGSSSANFRFTVELCTSEDGGGDCVSESVDVDVP